MEEADAAIAGKHFVAFDDPEVVDRFAIAPGQVSVELPVILLRDKSLKSEEVKLKMKVEANEWFVPGIDQNREFVIKDDRLTHLLIAGKIAGTMFGVIGGVEDVVYCELFGFYEF